jgi:hypothetical protein
MKLSTSRGIAWKLFREAEATRRAILDAPLIKGCISHKPLCEGNALLRYWRPFAVSSMLNS